RFPLRLRAQTRCRDHLRGEMFQTTNHRPQKKFAMRSPSNFDQFMPGADARRARERGYTMVALLAMMSLMALFALAAAPSVRQQAQREREKEAIFRGEQVSDAIRSYYRYRGGQGVNSLPTSIDQLLEGIPRGTKKLQILRPEAAHDPLSEDGEWKLVSPTSTDFGRFVESLTVYAGGVPPVPRQDFAGLATLIPRVSDSVNTNSEGT